MKKQNQPASVRFSNAIIEVLKESGGSGAPAEIIDLVIERLNISEQELEKTSQSGRSYVKNQIYWARFNLLKMGYVDFSQKGVWSLTDKGMNIKPDVDEHEEVESSDHKSELIQILKNLPDEGFERICLRLLREYGFQQIAVTKHCQGEGIDGNGILQISPFLSFRVIFQCRRADDFVNPSQIRSLRGAVMDRADKGIYMTTGYFTANARKEAHRFGAPPIEVVDGEKMIEMFEVLELGLKPKTIFVVDNRFFDDFR